MSLNDGFVTLERSGNSLGWAGSSSQIAADLIRHFGRFGLAERNQRYSKNMMATPRTPNGISNC